MIKAHCIWGEGHADVLLVLHADKEKKEEPFMYYGDAPKDRFCFDGSIALRLDAAKELLASLQEAITETEKQEKELCEYFKTHPGTPEEESK